MLQKMTWISSLNTRCVVAYFWSSRKALWFAKSSNCTATHHRCRTHEIIASAQTIEEGKDTSSTWVITISFKLVKNSFKVALNISHGQQRTLEQTQPTWMTIMKVSVMKIYWIPRLHNSNKHEYWTYTSQSGHTSQHLTWTRTFSPYACLQAFMNSSNKASYSCSHNRSISMANLHKHFRECSKFERSCINIGNISMPKDFKPNV